MELEEDDISVSVSDRYSRNPYWNVLLESEFLQTVANPKSKAQNSEDEAPLEPLIETPSWSLTILPGIQENLIRNFKSGEVTKRLNRRQKKNERKLKEQKELRELQGRVFNIEGDWDDLFLVQRRLGLEGPRTNPDTTDGDSESEDELTYDMINTDDMMPMLPSDIERFCNKKKPSKLIQEIREKISLANSKEKAKLEAIIELRKLRKPSKGFVRNKDTLNEALCISQVMAEFVVSPLQVPDTAALAPGPYRLRNRSQVRRKPYQGHQVPEKKTKKKKLHWYEMKPFDDPVLEKKRLHCLSQKIWDDRKRYEMEILRAENNELKIENEDLKNEIARLRSKHPESDDDGSLTDSSEQVVGPLSPVRSAGK